MLLGFALTQHCNLRCPHCIRDDVVTVQSIGTELVLRVTDEAKELFGDVTTSFTGGEPTLHDDWDAIVAGMHDRGVPYRFVSNGWHLKRMMRSIDRWPPSYVRLSLSGATEAIHDAERGRGSFRRVMMSVALLTSRRIPTALSIVIDRRDRHEVAVAARLARDLGVTRLHYILPQPVPGSVERDTDLAPSEWPAVRDEVYTLANEGGATAIQLDYGAPSPPGVAEAVCDTMKLNRIYVDAHGQLSLCCQLSEYGFNQADVVADLAEESLVTVWDRYQAGMSRLRHEARADGGHGGLEAFPSMRCANALGKLAWLNGSSAWSTAVPRSGRALPVVA